jgi:hypothetical protein
MWDVFRCENK